MTVPETDLLSPNHFIPGGASRQLAARLGLDQPSTSKRVFKVAFLIVITWVPLLCLSLAAGRASGGEVKFPFLSDPDVFGRYVIALPLLEMGAVLAASALASQINHFREINLIPHKELARFHAGQNELIFLRDSKLAEITILVIAIAFPFGLRAVLGFENRGSSWDHAGTTITLAGWWQILVSLPVLFFILLRRCWVFLIWVWFLFRISRLNLELSPTHPDHAGGLGFVGRGLAGFSLLLMAFSTIVSAGLSDEIVNRGQSLNDLKYHVALFVIIALVVIHAPLLVFSRRMILCRHYGLRDFGALVLRYDQAFEEKWIEEFDISRRDLLGSADISALADVATVYEHANDMWPIPVDTKALVLLAIAALIPMIPLIGTAIPVQEILMSLGEMLL